MLSNWLVNWIIRRAKRTPYFHLEGYMERFYFFRWRSRGEKHGPLTVRVHHILRSDSDRHFHDHPWPYVTLILRGGYIEYRQFPLSTAEERQRAFKACAKAFDIDERWLGRDRVLVTRQFHGPGSILFRRASDRHWLELIDGVDCWSLFTHLRKQKEWGFYTEQGFVPWRDYPSISLEEKAS